MKENQKIFLKCLLCLLISIIIVFLLVFGLFELNYYETKGNKYSKSFCLQNMAIEYCNSINMDYIRIRYSINQEKPLIVCDDKREISSSYSEFKFTKEELKKCGVNNGI